MSYFSDLDLRLREAGLHPERLRAPIHPDCGQPQMIIAYEGGKVVWTCRTVACVEAKRAALAASAVAP